MRPSSPNLLPQDLINCYELINIYNNIDASNDDKTQALEKINAIVQNLLQQADFSTENAREIKTLFKDVKIQSKDTDLWTEMKDKLKKYSNKKKYIQKYPDEFYVEIAKNIKSIRDFINFSKINKDANFCCNRPKMFKYFFEKFQPQISTEHRFNLALSLGNLLTKVDLNNFDYPNSCLSNEQMQMLQKTCPNLQSLNIAQDPSSDGFSRSDRNPLTLESNYFDILHDEIQSFNISEETDSSSIDDDDSQQLTALSVPISTKISIFPCFSYLRNVNLGHSDITTLNMLSRNIEILEIPYCEKLEANEFLNLAHSFPMLKILNLTSTMISTVDALPKNIEKLNISYCNNLSSEEFQKIDSSFSMLEVLHAKGKRTVHHLPKSLKEFDISFSFFLKTEEFQKFDDSFSMLEILNVACTPITTIPQLSKSLKKVSLDHCSKVKAEEFQKLDGSFSLLEILHLTGTGIAELGHLSRSLREVKLNSCKGLTAEAFQKLDGSFSKLETLYLYGTRIAELGHLPKSIKELNISYCRDLTEEAFQKLDDSFSMLEILHLDWSQKSKINYLPKSLKKLYLCYWGFKSDDGFQKKTFVEELEKLASSLRSSFPQLENVYLKNPANDVGLGGIR